MERIHLSIPEEQKEWLENHPEVNASGLLQNEIERLRENND